MNKVLHTVRFSITDINNINELKRLTQLDKSKIIRKAIQHLLVNELDS